MKYINKKCREVLLIAVILQLILVSFSWATLSEVALNYKSHAESEPTQLTEIELKWNYTGEDTINGYYYSLTNTSDYALTWENSTQVVSESVEIKRTKDDGEYYFYIAAYKVGTPPPTPPKNEMGPVTKYGPMTIDTRAPEIVTVIGPDTTDNSAIKLDISVSDSKNENEMISEINISEGLPGNGTWEEFTPSNSIKDCSYDLKQGEGQYTLRIQVKDLAGNIADADPYPITYTTADDLIMAQYTSVPTLSQWGVLFFLTILICIGIVATRQNVLAVKF